VKIRRSGQYHSLDVFAARSEDYEVGVCSFLLESVSARRMQPTIQRVRYTFIAATTLLLLEAALLWRFHGRAIGALLSDFVQLLIGILCVIESRRAIQRSQGVGRYHFLWLAVTFAVWTGAQSLGLYIDTTASAWLDPLDSLLFFLSGIPFGMLLFLDSEYEGSHFDRLHVLDFLQVCGFWVCVYLYFSTNQDLGLTNIGWGPFGWNTSLVFNGVLALSFALRAIVTVSKPIRAFFCQMALYLFLTGIADSYFSFAPNRITSGSWFDMIWSALLCFPLLIAAAWNEPGPDLKNHNNRGQQILVNQFFPLVYPFFSLLLIAQRAGGQMLSTGICGVIFAAVGVRVLIIQHRLVDAQERLQFEATHDVLTGLSNRRAILEDLEEELERQQRTGNSVCVLMADADHFKKINDAYGHSVGDEVLREVGERMTAALRRYDSLGRYGGEEFLVILPQCDGNSALASAERLRKAVADLPVSTNAGPIRVTVSIGLIAAEGSSEGVDCSTLLSKVDEALYRAKTYGRNRVETAFLWEANRT
jgi:diguanylate cyclase (GGDEF)-like protein